MSLAENWIVNDDFLPEGLISEAQYMKKYLCCLYSCQKTTVVARYKMSHHEKIPISSHWNCWYWPLF